MSLVRLDPLRRPKERVGREHIARHPLEERAVHAIPPTVAMPLLLLFWGALLSLLRGVADVGVDVVGGCCQHHYGSGGGGLFFENWWPSWPL